MPIIVLKTDLKSDRTVDFIRPILNLHPAIINWNVDTADIDNVLRIEAQRELTELDIITLLKNYEITTQSFID